MLLETLTSRQTPVALGNFITPLSLSQLALVPLLLVGHAVSVVPRVGARGEKHEALAD